MTDLSINPNTQAQELTDGFHLVIDALKLNGIDTIFGLPGIPITDLTRMAQAAGMRVISFRHEQNAGNAAAIAGFLTKTPGICLTVSAPGFLNGLTALANATTNCFPMILISGSSEREIVDLQQGDYEELDQLAIAKPLAKAAFRVLHAEDIGVGIARAIRAAVSGRPGGVYLDFPAKLFAQAIDAATGKSSLIKVVDPAPLQDGLHRLYDGKYAAFPALDEWRWHVTCVRDTRERDVEALLDAAKSLQVDASWCVDTVALMELRGDRYEDVARWAL